jgi:hypothetical protein
MKPKFSNYKLPNNMLPNYIIPNRHIVDIMKCQNDKMSTTLQNVEIPHGCSF